MRYAEIEEFDIANGEGIGVALYVQGCPFHCDGCFNPETWDFNDGKEWNETTKQEFLKLVDRPYIKRVSILGGEPLAPENNEEISSLIYCLKHEFPSKDIWLYTGYKYEDLMLGQDTCFNVKVNQDVLETCKDGYHLFCQSLAITTVDVLVDGQFEKDKKDLRLKFRGSSNQRILDMRQMRDNNFESIIIKE